jgi:hypothetical protein
MISTIERSPIELHLADGGHVIVAFADPAARDGEIGDAFVAAILEVDGGERDVERAICHEAADLGLHCAVSASRHPTVLVIADAAT